MTRLLVAFIAFAVSLVLAAFSPAVAQWTLECTGSELESGEYGQLIWLNSDGPPRWSIQDTESFRIMSSFCSETAEYTYTFDTEGNRHVNSTEQDLTGDGLFELWVFYCEPFPGPGWGLKIFDITTGEVLLERYQSDAVCDCTWVYIGDIDQDGILELVIKVPGEEYGDGHIEVYDTGVPASTAEARNAPRDFIIQQNYPNPFNPTTRIEYSISAPGHVTLNIFNVMGQKVATLVNAWQPQGSHTVDWNSTDLKEMPLSSGTYFYQITVDGEPAGAKKMLLIR